MARMNEYWESKLNEYWEKSDPTTPSLIAAPPPPALRAPIDKEAIEPTATVKTKRKSTAWERL